MAKPAKSLFEAPGFRFDASTGTLEIKHGGIIGITQDANGGWTYKQGANSYTITAEQADLVDTIQVGKATTLQISVNALADGDLEITGPGRVEVSGLTYTEADVAADGKFEPSVSFDTLISTSIEEKGVTATLEKLTDLTSESDAFKLLWDHLDDNYSYYNTEVNDAFIDLGIAYAQYVKDGGDALVDTTVKFTADGPDADTLPERSQSLHDNILGNFDEASIADKFGSDADTIFARIQDAGLGGLIGEVGDLTDGRPIFDGNDTSDPAPTRAFDSDYFGL